MLRNTVLSLGTQKIFTGSAIPVSTLVRYLQPEIRRPVIDETAITGLFDIRLEFVQQFGSVRSPESSPAASDPGGNSVFVALQQQLGLKLESAKGPVEVLVIDSASKPSEN